MNFPISKSNLLRSLFAGMLVIGTSFPSARAEALADFSGGLGESAPNEFPGTNGGGWSNGWQTFYWRNIKNGFSFAVKKDAAFKEGADVLQVSRQGDTGFVRLARNLDDAAVNPSAPHSISFQIRADEFTEAASHPFLFTIAGFNQNTKDNSPSNTAWCLGISEKKSTWIIYRKDDKGGMVSHPTDIRMELGLVFSITVRLFPEEEMFQVTIDSGGQSYESPRLPSPKGGARSETISFGGWVAGNGAGNFRWSLGPVRIEPIKP